MSRRLVLLAALAAGCGSGASEIALTVESSGQLDDVQTLQISVHNGGQQSQPVEVPVGAPHQIPPAQTLSLRFDGSRSGSTQVTVGARDSTGSTIATAERTLTLVPGEVTSLKVTLPGKSPGDGGELPDAGSADGSFVPLTQAGAVPLPGPPGSIAVGLLVGGDNLPDVAVPIPSTRHVVIASNPGGTWGMTSFQTTPPGPNAIAVGDFSGDGQSDLAITYFMSGELELWTDFNGTFTAAGPTSVGQSGPFAIQAVDLDGMAPIDLLVLCHGASNGVLVPFTVGQMLSLSGQAPIALSPAPSTLLVGLIDQDGLPDALVLFADAAPSPVELRVESGPAVFAAPTGLQPIAGRLVAGALGQLGGGPQLDLGAADASGRLFSALGTAAGDPFVAPIDQPPSPGAPVRLVLADLDGDGTLDVAAAVPTGLALWRGLGNGAFALPQTIALSGTPIDLVAADFDADGRADLALATQGPDQLRVFRTVP